MRASVMVGTALIVIGGTIFLRGLSEPKPDAGDGSITQEGMATAPWVTGLVVLAGIALVTNGRRRKA